MTELVLNISKEGAAFFSRMLKAPARASYVRAVDSEIIFIGITLVALQILDGMLTAIGVSHFGPAIEANPMIRNLMQVIGPMGALLLVKGTAVVVVLALCCLSQKVSWLLKALRFMPIVYLGAAILPWTYVLVFHL